MTLYSVKLVKKADGTAPIEDLAESWLARAEDNICAINAFNAALGYSPIKNEVYEVTRVEEEDRYRVTLVDETASEAQTIQKL